MLKYPECTPCPIVEDVKCLDQLPYKPTEELNFTTSFQAALRQIGPRKRKTTEPRRNRDKSVQRCVEAGLDQLTDARIAALHDGELQHVVNHKPQKATLGSKYARHRSSLLSQERLDDQVHETRHEHERARVLQRKQEESHLRRTPRRRTVYVPSKDTTICPIQSGLGADARSRKGFSLTLNSQDDTVKPDFRETTSLQGKIMNNHRKPLAVTPKRAPLQLTLRPVQEQEDQKDIVGTGPGKENVPPCTVVRPETTKAQVKGSKTKTLSKFGLDPECGADPPYSSSRSRKAFANDEPPADRRRVSIAGTPKYYKPSSASETFRPKIPLDLMAKRRNSLYYGPKGRAPIAAIPPSKVMGLVDGIEMRMRHKRCPVISEDITRPDMFEDAWLDHQESTIQQLINGIFDAAHKRMSTNNLAHQEKRRRLLQFYQGSGCPSIYQRLQASLLYGTLKPSNGPDTENRRLRNDVGLCQRFLTFWTDTYELDILGAATEVVIGREMSGGMPNGGNSQECTATAKARKKELEVFIESCLLCGEGQVQR